MIDKAHGPLLKSKISLLGALLPMLYFSSHASTKPNKKIGRDWAFLNLEKNAVFQDDNKEISGLAWKIR